MKKWIGLLGVLIVSLITIGRKQKETKEKKDAIKMLRYFNSVNPDTHRTKWLRKE